MKGIGQWMILVVVMCSSQAFAANHWVLGSFEQEANALNEAERLKGSTGLDVKVAQYVRNGVVYNRVLLNKSSGETHQQIADSTGIMPWVLYEDGQPVSRTAQRTESGRVNNSGMQFATVTDTAAVAETKVVYQTLDVHPPGNGESLVEYCVRKANPKERELFCSDSMLGRVLNASVN